MIFANRKTKSAAILFVILMISSISLTLTTNSAANYYNSYVYCFASPSTIGVGQEVLIIMWTADMPPDIGETAGTIITTSGRAGWADVEVKVTKPDNTTESFTIDWTDPVGGGVVHYVPQTVGTYYAQAFLPAVWKNTTAVQSYYTSAQSDLTSFTVREEAIKQYPEAPLPEGYWTRPINAINREWYILAGNWLGGAAQQPAGTAGGTTTQLSLGQGPESAHIM